MALDIIDISAEGLAAYVVAERRTGRAPSGAAGPGAKTGRRLTDCEAFLLRLGRKALELEGLRW
jgi:hypothetical protein